MRQVLLLIPTLLLASALGACGRPDLKALHTLACEQAAANLDPQSVHQFDTLRKALGMAPDVDPVAYCASLGVKLAAPSGSGPASDQAAPDAATDPN